MTGSASWEQIWALVGVIVAVGVAAFIASWRIQVYIGTNRSIVETKIELLVQSLDERLKAIEMFNAGAVVVLEHMKTFRDEVNRQYEQLRKEREQDMQGLHTRLDGIFNIVQMGRLRRRDIVPLHDEEH